MSEKPFGVDQHIFKASSPVIRVVPCHEHDLTKDLVDDFLDTADTGYIGVAPAYGTRCKLALVALSTMSEVLLVRLSSNKATKKRQRRLTGRKLLQSYVFQNTKLVKCAFEMDKFATSLFIDVHLRITPGVDLLSLSTGRRHQRETLLNLLGGELTLNRENVLDLFSHGENANAPVQNIALQAWVAYRAGTLTTNYPKLMRQPMVDTEMLSVKHLEVLAKIVRDANRLDALKPTRIQNDIKAEFSHKSGKLLVSCERFKTRIRSSSNQTLEISTIANGRKHTMGGHAVRVEGRTAMIHLNTTFRESNSKLSICTLGKEDPTCAEGHREMIILQALQRSNALLRLPFVQLIWLPSEKPDFFCAPPPARAPLPVTPLTQKLNPSQEIAVQAIVSDDEADRFVLVQGPPGTGKTSVIACATQCLIATPPRDRTVWLIAQSNVAVKNIAEKLAKDDIYDFKLLVSKEFHLDWHEHLYERIERNVIRSDDFGNHAILAERRLAGSRVILCTLSMLSHSRMGHFTKAAPLRTVIIDEASQIEIGDYIPMLNRYQHTLRKLVFIGDDKQLAPYGQDDLGDLRSIFEVSHLRDRALFLSTQYRMPVPLGNFISNQVYGGELVSQHSITTSKSVRFIDCKRGQEKKSGPSYVNIAEMHVVVALARQYLSRKLSFRIITPYDGQRSAIEKALKQEKLEWKDKCFNVDSFQGNEDDHIIVSLTRSEKIGFLKEDRRVNVMLTRCRKSMVICTSRAFLCGVASGSLVSILAEQLGAQAWIDSRGVQFKGL